MRLKPLERFIGTREYEEFCKFVEELAEKWGIIGNQVTLKQECSAVAKIKANGVGM